MGLAEEVYARQLFARGYGLPLWSPEPTESGEVQIGDVGYVWEGAFHRIFNVILPETDPVNTAGGVPENFKVLQYNTRFRHRKENYVDQGPLCSKSVKRLTVAAQASVDIVSSQPGGGYKFTCSHDEGALLVIGGPTITEQVPPNSAFRNYMSRNHDNWQAYCIHNQYDDMWKDIVFVTGFVKTSAWAVAAFLDKEQSHEVYFSGQAPFVSADFRISASEHTSQSIERRTGPRRGAEPVPSDRTVTPDSTPAVIDQCIFLHYYKFKTRFWLFPTVIKAAAEPKDLSRFPDDMPPPDGVPAGGDIDDDGIEIVPGPRAHDPLDDILDYILASSEATFAVAHISDLYTLCDGEDHIPSDLTEILKSRSPRVTIDEFNVGMLETHGDHEEEPTSPFPMDLEYRNPLDDADFSDKLAEMEEYYKHHNDQPYVEIIPDDQAGEGGPTAIAPNGDLIASGGTEDDMIRIWESRSGKCIQLCTGHSEPVNAVDFGPDGSRLISGSNDRTAIIWDPITGESLLTLVGHEQGVWSVAYSPDGRKVVTGSFDLTVRLWDAVSGASLFVLTGHKSLALSVKLSPNGKRVVSSGSDNTAVVWDVESGEHVTTLQGHKSVIWCMIFSPDSRRIITGSEDSTCRIWNIETGDELVTIRDHIGPVWCIAYSPDGQRIVSGSHDTKLVVSSTFTGEPLATLESHSSVVHAVAFSPNGRLIGSGSADASTRVWDALTGKIMHVFHGHTGKVNNVHFTPNADRVISSADDGAIRIWKIPSRDAMDH